MSLRSAQGLLELERTREQHLVFEPQTGREIVAKVLEVAPPGGPCGVVGSSDLER